MFGKIIDAFQKLGQPAKTCLWDEKDKAAFELGVARKLATAADARKGAAKKAATKLGLIDNANREPGEVTIWTGKVFKIVAKTAAPRSMISGDALMAELLQHVNAQTAASIVAKATVQAKAATSFEVEEI